MALTEITDVINNEVENKEKSWCTTLQIPYFHAEQVIVTKRQKEISNILNL